MVLSSDAVERCLELLAQLVRRDSELSRDFEASIEAFFRGPAPSSGGPLGALLAARRHLEWFLVEHHVTRLGGGSVAPHLEEALKELAQSVAEETGDDDLTAAVEAAFDALLRSHTGIFEVEQVNEDAGVWLRDVTGFGSFAAASSALAGGLNGGELLVGRLYPAGEGLHAPSPAVSVVRGQAVASALQRDLERIRESQQAKVLRVSQGELEAMFFGAGGAQVRIDPSGGATPGGPAGPGGSKDPMGDALALLRSVGFGSERAKSALQRLAQQPRDPQRLVHGGDDMLGQLLESVAFDTTIDLEKARRALIGAWEIVSGGSEQAPPAAQAPQADDEDAKRIAAVEAFAQARARGEDPTALVKSLELELGVAPDEDETAPPAPDFPGVVGAMIDEMRWELGATRPDFDTAILEPLDHLASFAKPIGVFEELRGDDLLRFATFWLQEKRALTSDAEAGRLVMALREFCEWSLEAHEVDLGSVLLDALDGLEESLPRTRRVNELIGPNSMDEADPGEVYTLESLDECSAEAFEDSADQLKTPGGESIRVILPDALRAELRIGDRLRGRVAITGHVDVRCCYPPEQGEIGA